MDNKSQKKLVEDFTNSSNALFSSFMKGLKMNDKNLSKEDIELTRKAMEITNLEGLIKQFGGEGKNLNDVFDNFMKENGGKTK